MAQVYNELESPTIARLCAYGLTLSGIIGILLIVVLASVNVEAVLISLRVSPAVLLLSILFISLLGLVTGGGLIKRKKYGWILTQFLLIYLSLKAIYGILLLPFNYFQPIKSSFGLNILIFVFFVVLLGFFLVYFNRKYVLKYYHIEKEESNWYYILCVLTCIGIFVFRLFLRT